VEWEGEDLFWGWAGLVEVILYVDEGVAALRHYDWNEWVLGRDGYGDRHLEVYRVLYEMG
jgi:hypothetical protein